MYQMKILTWVSWKLTCHKDANIGNWWLATEVRQARGFHDLVLKYTTNANTPNAKYMYRFMQIKHKTSLEKNANITNYHLTSQNRMHRQCSLFYLFRSYVKMLDSFEKITPDQIVDLTVFTNLNINAFNFLVPVENDKLYGFEGKGKKYRIDVQAIKKVPGIMIGLYGIEKKDDIITGFLRKLVFLVSQPSEPDLEKLIIEEMGNTFNVPQVFYNNLYKNIIDWFLVYNNGKAPYLTEDHVMKYLKNTQDVLWEAKRTEMLVDPVSKMSEKFKLLSL